MTRLLLIGAISFLGGFAVVCGWALVVVRRRVDRGTAVVAGLFGGTLGACAAIVFALLRALAG